MKANLTNGFSSFWGTDGINKDIGLSSKITIFGRGTIWFDTTLVSHRYKVKKKRNFNELLTDFDVELSKFKKNQTGLPDSANAISSFVSDYCDEMKINFTKKESDYISKKRV